MLFIENTDWQIPGICFSFISFEIKHSQSVHLSVVRDVKKKHIQSSCSYKTSNFLRDYYLNFYLNFDTQTDSLLCMYIFLRTPLPLVIYTVSKTVPMQIAICIESNFTSSNLSNKTFSFYSQVNTSSWTLCFTLEYAVEIVFN